MLGSVLYDPAALVHAAELLRREDFYRETHRTIFAVAVAMLKNGEPVDLVTVTDKLRDKGQLVGVGGAEYVTSLMQATATPSNIAHHVRIVLEKSRRRDAILTAQTLAHALETGGPQAAHHALPQAGALYDTLTALIAGQMETFAPEVLSLAELLATPEPQHRYVAAPIVPLNGVTLLVGYSGAFKTWLLCELALSVATARPFLNFGVSEPRRVLFIEAEMSRNQLARRFRQLKADPSCDRLHFAVDQTLNLYDSSCRTWLSSREEEVIIIDPAVRVFRGDENSATDVSLFFRDVLLPLKRAGKTVVLAHHYRKATPGVSSDPDAMIRGSGDWKAFADSVLAVKRLDDWRAQVQHLKSRDSREVPSFIIRLDGDEMSMHLVYEGQTEKILPGLVPVRDAILSALLEARYSNELEESFKGVYNRDVIRSTVRSLVSEGIVERTQDGRRVLLHRNGQLREMPRDPGQGTADG